MIASKLLSYKLYRLFGIPKIFPMNLTIGLTYKCNSRCKTCYIWKKKDFSGELSLEEFKKFFKKTGKNKIFLIIFTGGEPFLRNDLVEICYYAEKYCKPHTIVIPTNGILVEKIVKEVERILQLCKKTHITINISLDHIGKKHDRIRGVPGNFTKAISVYKKLKKFEEKYPNFDVSIHTVISKFNYKDFPKIAKYVMEKLKPKNYITEIAEERNELVNIGSNVTPNFLEYTSAINFLEKILSKKKNLTLKQAFRLEYYKLIKKILKKKKQVIPCYAGIASAQIDPTGEVWFCCVRAESIGNLRDYDYDLMKMWYNEKANKQRKSIMNKECYCPLASASYTNMALDFISSFKVIVNFLKSRLR